MPDNEIYKFMKSNNLTQLDEKAFIDKYSAPEKAKEVYSFFVDNKLTDLDSSGFYDKYLKKKAYGVASAPTESKSQLPSYLREGKKMAQVGFATPQIVSEDIKARKEPKVRISPKLFATPGVVDVDIVEEDEDDGSYKNLAQNLANNFLISSTEIGAGLAQILREGAPTGVPREKKKTEALYTDEGEKTPYAQTVTWAKDPLAKVALGLNGISEPAKELQQTQSAKLPDTFLGNTLTSLSAIVPDLAATALMPEAKAVQGASFLQKTGSLLFNNFTKYLMVKEPLVGYNEAKMKGEDQSAMQVLGNVGKGAVSGMELALLGAGSSLATKSIMKQAAKAGLVGAKGFAAKELANLATDVVAYGLISPSIHTLYEEGRLPTSKEISEGAGIALAFRLKDAIPSISTFRDLNKAVDNIQQAKQGAAIYNFLQATPESIVRVYNGKESANELHLKAMEAAKAARDATDPIEKQKAVIQASTMAKAANVKQVAEMFVQDKGLTDYIKNADLPAEAKMAIVEKAEAIRKSVDPIEIKKTQAGQRMQQGQRLIQDLTLEMNGEQDPVRKAELQFRINETEKGLKMQENELMSLIEGQAKEAPLDLTDVNTVKQSRKSFNEQVDLKLESLDKADPDYFEKVESLNKQREERNDYFDRVLEDKKQEEKGISVMTPEEFNQVENIEVSLEGQKAEASVEEIVTEVKPTELEAKKADIEERRKEELRTSLELLPLVSKEERSPELQKRYDKVEAKEKEINAKYDAELAALEEVKPIEVEEIKPTDIKTVEKISSVMPYVVEDRNIVEPVIEKIKNNELINEEELYNAAQVLENLQSKTENESLKNLINPVIDKILTYENQSKTEVSTVTQKGAVTRVGTDVRKKEVSKSIGQFEGSRATITDKNGKAVTGYLKTDDGKYNLYDESGSKIASIGEKQITDRDVVLPSTDVVPNPITIDKNGNIKSITLQLQKVDKGGGVLPDRVITIDFKNAEKALDYAIQLRAEQVGEFSDPEFEEIITQVEQEIPIKKEVKISEPKAEVKPAEVKKEVKKTAIETVSDDLLNYLGIAPSDVKFSKTTGKPEIIKSPESIQTDVVNQMNKMNLVNEGVDLNLSSTTKEKIDVDELNSRLDYPLKKVNFKDFEGYPIMFTISDQLRTGDVVNPNTGQTVKDLKGGIGFNGTKGHENMAWANTTKDEGDGLYIKAQDIYNSNKSLFEKAWANGDLPSGQIPMAVVKMAESSILSNEAVFRTGIQNVETLPKKNRKQAVTNITESLKSKVKIESDAVKRGTDANGKRYAPLTMAAKEKIISQSKNILKIIQEKKYIDIVDLLKDIKIFSLPERAIIVNQVFYGSPTAAGAKEIDINRSKPKTKVSVDLIGNADPSLIHIGKITDLLTEPSTKNIPSTHITAIVGVKVAEKVNGKWVKSGGTIETDHPNYPYGVEGGSIGVLEQPIHMKDAFGEAYGSVLSIITKNEAKKASISEGASFSQGLPVQSGLSNKVFSPAIAKGRLDAVDKLSGFLRQAFPTTTFFTTQEAWNSALEEPNVKKHLKDGDVIYAFTTDGNVYINPNLKTTKAALHETGHIWAGFVKENNSALYDKGLKLVEDTKELKKAIEEYGDTPLAREEALMELMSSKGDTIVNAAQKAKFKEWLLSLYKYISDNFKSLMKLSPKEVENLTLDKFLEGMLADLLSGKELTTGKIKGETKFSKGSQEDAIREFIEIQRKKGISDKEIKAGVEKVSDQIGLDKSKIDDLFKKEAETVSIAYKDLSRIEKRKIINSKFDELIKELKIDKRCQ